MIHFNDPWMLPPVGCTILVMLDGTSYRAVRTDYIERKTDLLEYKIESTGELVTGLLKWAYP